MKTGGKELHWARVLQKKLINTANASVEVAERGVDACKETLKRLDHDMSISEKAREFGAKVHDQSKVLDGRYDLKTKFSKARASVDKGAGEFANLGKELVKSSGMTERADYISQRTREAILDPARKAFRKTGIGDTVAQKLGEIEQVYGKTREVIKPYFAAEDTHALLANARRCILVTSPKRVFITW